MGSDPANCSKLDVIFSGTVPTEEECPNAQEAIFRRTDCLRAETGGGGNHGGRDLPQFAHCADGLAEATFYRWKKVYAGMGVSEIRRLKQLEDENGRLKRMVADLSLDKTMASRCPPSVRGQWRADALRKKW